MHTLPHYLPRYLLLLTALVTVPQVARAEEPVSHIAFGSCCRQDKPAPIWESIAAQKPQRFLFIGDNIYGDSQDMAVLRAKWKLLTDMPGYQKLQAACPIL